jgi:hypothetical protein
MPTPNLSEAGYRAPNLSSVRFLYYLENAQRLPLSLRTEPPAFTEAYRCNCMWDLGITSSRRCCLPPVYTRDLS